MIVKVDNFWKSGAVGKFARYWYALPQLTKQLVVRLVGVCVSDSGTLGAVLFLRF